MEFHCVHIDFGDELDDCVNEDTFSLTEEEEDVE